MAIIIDGGCVSPDLERLAQAAKSRRRSKGNSKRGPAKDGTLKADKKQTDLDVELSLLQSVYEQAINAGLKATSFETETATQMPVIVIRLFNVSKCPECGSWISGRKCPMC